MDETALALRHAARFAALGHEARLAILRLLLVSHPDGLVAGEVQAQLGVPASTLSHHLDALRQQDLVVQAREGRFVRYRASVATVESLVEFLSEECCSRAADPADCALSVPRGAAPRGRTGSVARRRRRSPA